MVKILFVCLGNICRSPAAHGVMEHFVSQEKLGHRFEIDSAGILDFHEGKLPDQRMRTHAKQRGYELTSRSRPVKAPQDFEIFDWIVAMDKRNMADLKSLCGPCAFEKKIVLLSDFFTTASLKEVPDPYYGGPEGFELVLDLVEEACREIITRFGRE